VTINLGHSGASSTLYGYDPTGAGNQILTLASSVSVDVHEDAFITGSSAPGDGIVNDGAIDVTGSAGRLAIGSSAFTNSGTIDAANGGSVIIESTTFTTTASSVIAIGANSSVTIDPTNAWTNLGSITLASGASLYLYGSVSAASLGSISNSGGAVDIVGIYNNAGKTLNGSGSPGQLELYGGTISGGTVTSAGVAFSYYGGTLTGVTFDGPLYLEQNNVYLANGTTVVGSSGSGPGTINVMGADASLNFDNTETISNTTINLGYASGSLSYLYEYDPTGAGNQVLTLASSVTLDASSITIDAPDYAYITGTIGSGDGIVNQGVIELTGSGGYLTIDPNDFTNSGTIDATATGGFLTIDPTTFTNSGTIDAAAAGGFLTIDPTTFTNSGTIDLANGVIDSTTFTTTASSVIAIGANSELAIYTSAWTNVGSITLASGSDLYLTGTTSAASLGSITNSGSAVVIGGTYDNSGQTLNGSGSPGQLTLYGGTISGGTITSAGVAFTESVGTLSGVTFDGPLNLTSASVAQSVELANGTTVVGSSGSGPGAINVTGEDSTLYFDNTQTVSNDTINLGSSYFDFLYEFDTANTGNQVLTLASSRPIHLKHGV